MLRAHVSTRWNGPFAPASARLSGRDRRRRPRLEGLESRELLSGVTPTSAIVNTPDLAFTAGATPSASATPLGGAILSPSQMRQAYGLNQAVYGSITGNGAGQTIAIIDAYNEPTIASDLASFDSYYSLPAPGLTQVNQSGGTTLPGTAPAGTNWGLETALDVEWAHVIAPAANILLVECNDSLNTDLFAGVNYARSNPSVSVVSMSFGAAEYSSETSYDGDFLTPQGHKGVTFVASSGDSGSNANGSSTSVEYPASSPNVLGVGGTTLTTSNGTYVGETAWSGSGGGISVYEPRPSYQNGVQGSAYRAVPDVAMDADPNTGVNIYDATDDGSSTPWTGVGGTSLAAPMWAGIVAVGDQVRIASGYAPTLDGATETITLLYAFASSDVHDVTSGSNGAYQAGAGYDEVTGRGSPVANNIDRDFTALYGNAQAYGNATLTSGQSISSPNGLFTLTMATNGNLIETNQAGSLIWSSNTGGNPGAQARMQSDGNLVVVSTSNTALWYSGTSGNNSANLSLRNTGALQITAFSTGNVLWTSNTLLAGQQLTTNQLIFSPNGQYYLIMQTDGNLVEYGPNSAVIWQSNTHTAGSAVRMQSDGNLVLFNGNTAYFTSGTAGDPGAVLALDSTGRLYIIYNGVVVWIA